MRVRLKQLWDMLITNPLNGQFLVYESASKKWKNKSFPKMWTGSVTVSGNAGQFTVDYSSAGFTAPPKVFVTGHGGSNRETAIFASTTAGTITATGCSGRANTSNTTGVLLVYQLVNAPAGTVIDVFAIGN